MLTTLDLQEGRVEGTMFLYIESVKVHPSTAGLTIDNDRDSGHDLSLRFFKKV
jgi:hypothetical protein